MREEGWGGLMREDAEEDPGSEQEIKRRTQVSKGGEQRWVHESEGGGLRRSRGPQGGSGGHMGSVGGDYTKGGGLEPESWVRGGL